jgi:rRNA maturation endonuclease Nob1
VAVAAAPQTRAPSWACRSCGTEVGERSKFCHSCGATLEL